MKKQLMLFFLLCGFVAKSQTDVPLNMPGVGYGASNNNLNFRFDYGGIPVGHYALGWYGEGGGSPVGYLSGYAGLRFFTGGYPRLTVNGLGNVGIGTLTPMAALDVHGNIQISGQNMSTPPPDLNYGLFPYGGVGLGIFSGATDSNQGIGIWTNPDGTKTEVMRILSGGNVGIGTITPREKLSVNGKIRAHEIKVETANWPDYVFAKDYQLPSLVEIEKHIQENGHLRGIPSAKDAEANGINLGEMNAKLLQKIEELTLHLIAKEKALEIERTRNDKQEERLKKIELLIKK